MDIESQKTLLAVVDAVNSGLAKNLAQTFADLEQLEITVGPILIPAFIIKVGKQ